MERKSSGLIRGGAGGKLRYFE